MQHQRPDFVGSFPRNIYPRILPNQQAALEFIAAQSTPSVTLELPTGSGKTAIGYTYPRALLRAGARTVFYVVPTKTLVDQVRQLHPDVLVAYGRNEHRCLYYSEDFGADEVPCSMLGDCPHRVDMETGRTEEPGEEPCPYLAQKYEVSRGGRIVVCTVSFYLFTQLFNPDFHAPDGLVIDEVHKLARIVRNSLSHEITDYHIQQSVDLLRSIGAERQAAELENFLGAMVRIVRSKPQRNQNLLEPDELRELIRCLDAIDEHEMSRAVRDALRSQRLDPVEHREVLRKTEIIIRDLRRYMRSLAYSLPTDDRDPLSYVYAYYTTERQEGQRVQHTLHVKSYYVRPIIRRLLSPNTLAMSATIGNPEILGFETGIEAPFRSFPSDFPSENCRVFMPTDTPNLSFNERSRQQPTRILRKIAQACRRFASRGLRSLVVVVSNAERDTFIMLAREEGVRAVSYGNNSAPRDAARRFKDGEGDVLVGTTSNYGEGVDLPRSMAPVIFLLRPGYPSPRDPGVVFEERRFGGLRWRLWNWRVMMEALQVRGRNIRGPDDVGVTFFISQQFRRFLFNSLPEWLQPAYHGKWDFDRCIDDTERLLLRAST